VALAAPERVRTLTLAVTYGGGGEYGHVRGRINGAIARALSDEERVDWQMTMAYTEAFFADRERALFLRNAMLGHPEFQSAEGYARQAAASGRHETRDRLHELTMPVHVIGAALDVLVPVWKSKELARLIPGAKLTIFEDVGHGVSWERADEFNTAVTEFLAAAPPEAVR
jgi:pimeloyl-ACP methyl ester carboxylesterase